MFRALVELSRDLEGKNKLPHPGFYYYRQPLKWVVHIWEDRLYLEASLLDCPRPYSGRTSDIQAHLLTDEAGYALGVSRDKTGIDKRANEKHKNFCELMREFKNWEGLNDPALREMIYWLEIFLNEGRIRKEPRFNEVLTKDWVSFVPEVGPLHGQHLFEHAEAKSFWLTELRKRSSPSEKGEIRRIQGECAICGIDTLLIGKIPLGVKLVSTSPLHSINANAFTSFVSGVDTFKKAHLGVCFECGDNAARAFNFLSESKKHRRDIIRDTAKRDSLSNQIALFWIKAPSPLYMGERVLNFNDINAIDWGIAMHEGREENWMPKATPSQLLELLKLPWKPTESAVHLDDFGFHLALLSPNVGRIALREWITVSLTKFKGCLENFLETTKMISVNGDSITPISLGNILDAVASKNPNLTRGLLRTAYTGVRPPADLHVMSSARLARLFVSEASLRERNRRSREKLWDDAWPQALAAAIKLGRYFGNREVEKMTELNPENSSAAYLCGCLLATLEEAQQTASYVKKKKRQDTTIVNRFYGGASSAPKGTFGRLMTLATVAYLPDAGKDINIRVEEIIKVIDEVGGFPKTLNLEGQSDFALGFYHQRATFRSNRSKSYLKGGQI